MFSSLHENGGEHRGVAGVGAMGGTKWIPKKCKTLLSHKLLSRRSPKGFAYLTLSLSIYRDRGGGHSPNGTDGWRDTENGQRKVTVEEREKRERREGGGAKKSAIKALPYAGKLIKAHFDRDY